MFGKILIKGKIELLTGMHIGTGGEFAAIGAVDSPVICDKLSGLPIIPGSTLKGKLRSVLARKYSRKDADSAGDDCTAIQRLFGYSKKKESRVSRLIFSDMAVSNMDELKNFNIHTPTEVKFENTINRLSGIANPRQIERVIRGCCFDMEIIYDLTDEDEASEDMELLAEGLRLLQYDYIGGHGSRGYGKIKFSGLSAEEVIGETSDELVSKINKMLEEVN
ncbi:MAG: type III-A CRISPR-associated RAMP protein Csm3 [Oscillospiraceae bacterium]|nr:type III-A CRISPR-associated RAMP protein Csm3 [Oscillospiraceae bacterium]